MALVKHGDGNVLPEEGEQKLAAKGWSEKDGQELASENEQADK